MIIKPIKTSIVDKYGDIISFLNENLKNEKIETGDLIVITSKVISILEGGLIDLSMINASETAIALGTEFGIEKRFSQVVINEADQILGGAVGVIAASKSGIIAPYSGVDRSNIPENYAIPWPKDPPATAEIIKEYFKEECNRNIGVIISDSQVVPIRKGTYGIALGIAGFNGIINIVGERDLFKKKLKITCLNLADTLATTANIMMGESDEQYPIVLIKDFPIQLTDTPAEKLTKDLHINRYNCMYKQIIDYSFLN